MILTKTKGIMNLMSAESDYAGAIFFNEILDEPGVARELVIKREDWEDMGEPDVVTVTIEPGDLIN